MNNLKCQRMILCEPKAWMAALVCFETGIKVGTTKADTDFWGDPIPRPSITNSGVAVLPIKGVLAQGLPSIAEKFGIMDTDKLRKQFREMMKQNPKRMVLDMNTPGGSVGGIPELANDIYNAQRAGLDIVALANPLMASAGYWIGSQASALYVTGPSAEVGSIGVYTYTVDLSKSLEMDGIKVELFAAGKFKAAGFPYVPMSDDQRNEIAAGVGEIYGMFTAAVTRNRPGIQSDAMEGQTFLADKALKNGMADGMMDMDELMDEMEKNKQPH